MSLFAGNHEDLMEAIEDVYKADLSLYIHGTFGIGKTYAIREWSKKKAAELKLEWSEDRKDINDPKKFMFIPIILHQHDPAELGGLIFPNLERTKAEHLRLDLLPIAGQGVIVFDELNLAPPMVKNNAYQIIEDRRVGATVIPKGYISIAAGNLMDDRGNTFEDPMPLNNRFLHFQLNVPTVDDLNIMEQDESGKEHVARTVKGWLNGFAIPNGVDYRIQNFLSYQRGYLYKFNPTSDSEEIAVATPRMWTKISATIKGIADNDYRRLERLVSMGAGSGMGLEFVAWLKLSSKYDISKIFTSGKIGKMPTEVDTLYSLMSALVGYYVENPDSKNAVKLFDVSRLFPKEHTIMVLNQAKSQDNQFFPKIRKEAPDKYKEFSDDIFKFLI